MQNYQNHRRLNPFHHFIITPLSITLLVFSITFLFREELSLTLRIFFLLIGLLIAFTALIARSYGIKNQDRIIRLEMRQRYFEMTGKPFSEKEKHLRLSQIIALRFAGDAEILVLIDKAIDENLSSKEIKLLIKDWQGDYHRV